MKIRAPLWTAVLSVTALACGPLVPTDPWQPHPELDGMYLAAVEWPDTLVAGQVGIATVQLVLASGVPYEPDRYTFFSPDVGVAGLHPTARSESKQVLAFAPGKVTITMGAHIDTRCNCPGWHAQLTREIVVLPSP